MHNTLVWLHAFVICKALCVYLQLQLNCTCHLPHVVLAHHSTFHALHSFRALKSPIRRCRHISAAQRINLCPYNVHLSAATWKYFAFLFIPRVCAFVALAWLHRQLLARKACQSSAGGASHNVAYMLTKRTADLDGAGFVCCMHWINIACRFTVSSRHSTPLILGQTAVINVITQLAARHRTRRQMWCCLSDR